MKKQIALLLTAFSLACGFQASVLAAGQPIEVEADSIDYNAKSGVVKAQGNVIFVQGGATLTGSEVTYNSQTKNGLVTGGVKAIKEDMTLTAAQVQLQNNTHFVATGSAVLTKGDNRLTGPTVEYDSSQDYALVPQDAVLTGPDGTMTANRIEAFLKEDRAQGLGNVHVVSETRKLDARADKADYYGIKTAGQGKLILTGNARAIQDGNTLTGETLTLYLDNKTVDAQGRTKLVIVPK